MTDVRFYLPTQELQMPSAPPRLAVHGLSVTFPSFTLAPLSLEIRRGERVAFVGPNGSGKSTTFRAMAGRFNGYSGMIRVDGTDLRTLLPLGRRNIGFLPESFCGYPWMTVAQLLEFLRQFYPDWDDAYATHLVDRLRIPRSEKLARLSKGTRMKVSFVAAEAYRPVLLLLDEPTSGLDPAVRKELIDAIVAAERDRPERVLLFSTHLLEDVELLADRVIVLANGSMRLDASVVELRAAHHGAPLSAILFALLGRADG
jgi:ABC-2 type transport system ATP-binding protein